MTDEQSVNRAPSPAAHNQPHTSQLFDYGVHLASRTLFLFEEISAQRELMPNSVVMVHPGYSSVGFDHDENTQRTAEYSKRMRDRCCELLAERMGITLKQFLRRFTWDTYLSARQAVELGLADRVLEPHASLSLVAPHALKAC